jgi:hypothetical protein
MQLRLSIFFIILVVIEVGCTSQPKIDKDQLVTEVCKELQVNRGNEDDSVKWLRVYQSHLQPYLNDLPEDSSLALYDYVTIRLQRECVVFRKIARAFNTKKGNSDWQDTDIEPESEINTEDYQMFFKIGRFKYLETNGDTALVNLTDSTWEDRFIDGTYSRLSLEKLRTTEFVITCIESNNNVRMNFSKPGDQYRYKILERHNNYFSMYVQPVKSKVKSLFKLYY